MTLLDQARLRTVPIALAGLLAWTASAAGQDTAGSIHVVVNGLRSDAGQVLVQLFSGPDGYPTDPALAAERATVRIKRGVARARFAGRVAGAYAIAVCHDENANGKCDANLLGIPTEGVGASNDATGTLGPPAFEDAKFELGSGEVRMPIAVRY